jgi:AraC-like DNA-binding protein
LEEGIFRNENCFATLGREYFHIERKGEVTLAANYQSCSFPTSLKKPFMINGAGLIVCRQGNFTFSLNMKAFSAQAGETVFIPEDSLFQVLSESEDLQLFIFIYQIEPIRDIIGNSVAAMYLYMQLRTEPCYVWNTGDEEEVLKYMSLLDNTLHLDNNTFNDNEQRLLLLGLTYRICSIYNRKLMNLKTTVGHKHEIFIRLIQLIDAHYTEERGVEFYADKLCLSPKYLSALSKSVCGFTVQELIFKSIIRKSISLLKNTQKNIQEIADFFNFPNASYFGTFFKKQTGMSPQQYRKK